MGFNKEINQASKITLTVVVITSIFALLGKLSSIVPIVENKLNIKVSIEHFFKVNMLWLIAAILMILGLGLYIKKADGSFNLNFLHNPTIRFATGLLIIFEGIINLSKDVSVLILNIQTFGQVTSSLEDKADELIRGSLTSDVIIILTLLLQIFLGLYFILYKKAYRDIEHIV